MVTAQANGMHYLGGFHLQFDLAASDPAGGPASAVASFNASLDSLDRSELDLAGMSGLLVDTAKLSTMGPLCITIHDALRRHTPPKRISVASGAAALQELETGTDGRISCDTRYALYLWLTEIYDESKRGVGTRLIRALQDHLNLQGDVSVLLDFGVQDEEDGYVSIFFPKLTKLNLKLSGGGQFARGTWADDARLPGKRRDVGIVHL